MSSLPLAQLGKRPEFARDHRFAALFGAPAAPPAEVVPGPDPLTEAYERGYREGAADAAQDARLAEQDRDAARGAIELAFARLNADDAAQLAERMRQTVLALCESAVLPLALDSEGLRRRVERAVGMLQRAQDERVVRLHPEDMVLIGARLPASLAVEADAGVERGGLRIETADGGIEDGPSHWRRALAEAFQC
ncbi:MAG TPA: FliH/SctL family protein [Croceibacterium sp.]